MSRLELEERIRFALHQLGSRNAHHEFEHICRRIARQRICSNILPATGPVTSGGDQGRDFETFRTYLANNIRGASTFVGLAADQPVAFGCTLQATGIANKIKGDLATIAAGAPSDSVHYFLGAVDFPVAKRHEAQKDARDAYSLHLEIYDAASITEFLAEPDLFWIANEYLSIPADAYPRVDAPADWYTSLHREWSDARNRPVTYASFQSVKRALRSLLSNESRRPDVTFWIECLRNFKDGPDLRLADMARYETAVASQRIKLSMSGLEDDLRDFIGRATASQEPSRLIDAATLIQYTTPGTLDGTVSISVSELSAMHRSLQQAIKKMATEARSPTQKCIALDLSAIAQLIPEPESAHPPDLTAVFRDWNKLVDLVDRAPLFPLQELSDRLIAWLPFLVDYSGYELLTEKLDAAVARRTGRVAAASNRAERAARLSENGRLVQALRELNRAKIDWFSSETLPLALGSMMLAGRHYAALGLVFAAKYYALAAAYIAIPSDDPRVKPIISRALFMAADCDYLSGAWLQSISLLHLAQVGHQHYDGTPLANDDADLHRALLHGSVIYGIAQADAPEIQAQVHALTQDWPDADLLKENAERGAATFLAQCQDGGDAKAAFFRAPFSDCREQQTVEWSALGLEWSISWKTCPELNLAAEQFIAVAQIATCDLATSDLYIVPSRLRVELVAGAAASRAKSTRVPDNSLSAWQVSLPTGAEPDGSHVQDIVVLVSILHEQSLRSDKWPILSSLEKEGLFQNTMVAAPYSTVYSAVAPPPRLENPLPNDPRYTGMNWRNKTDDALSWNTNLVEEYTREPVGELLTRRYDMGLKLACFTLPRLRASASVRAVLHGLRDEGWLDWQLLAAISGLSTAWRVAAKGLRMDSAAGSKAAQRLMRNAEQEDWQEVPLHAFSKEALERQLQTNLLSTLSMMGLALRQMTPDFPGLLKFARVKLRYFEDDIEHVDPFAARQSHT